MKIGISVDVPKRKKTLNTANGRVLEMDMWFTVYNCDKALEQTIIHRLLEKFRIPIPLEFKTEVRRKCTYYATRYQPQCTHVKHTLIAHTLAGSTTIANFRSIETNTLYYS